jgi:hypothetical protein
VGASLGVDLNPYVGLRGNFAFARNELRQNSLDTGTEMNRFFYDGGIQVQYPTANGWTPYLFVGGGAVTLDPVGDGFLAKTKPAGTGALGVNYTFPGTNFGVTAEGKGWLYDLSELNGNLAGFDRTQLEVTWSAGLTYRIPFNDAAGR